MKKKFENMERRGLPGGPNEMFSYVTGMFSTEGYKSDSPDKNNPANLIASGSITMENVEFPVMGMDNLGNSKMMMPGNNYEFPGDMVLEIPMAQKAGETNYLKTFGQAAVNPFLPLISNLVQQGKENISENMLPFGYQNSRGYTQLLDGSSAVQGVTLGKNVSKATNRFVDNRPGVTANKLTNRFGLPAINKIVSAVFDLPKNKVEKRNIEELYANPSNIAPLQERKDLLNILLGLDQEYNSIPIQDEYKPSKSKDSDSVYYKSPATESYIINQLQKDPQEFMRQVRGYKDGVNYWAADDQNVNTLGNYTLSLGEDDKGKYISYYDIWDLQPFKNKAGTAVLDAAQSVAGLNAPEVYGRVYLKDDAKLGFKKEFTRVPLDERGKGGSVSWQWKGKTYSGTLIPSMEDEKNRYARTKNGKIKTLPKANEGGDPPVKEKKRTRLDIYGDIVKLNEQLRDTDSQLEQFRQNIGTIYKGFQQAGDETLTDEQRQTEIDTLLTNSSINPGLFVANTSNPNEGRVVGLDSVPKVTRDWLRSIGGYGCTTYGCGLLRQAGAVTEDGSPFPMISGNSQLNSMIERNEGGLQMKLMDPGFTDLKAGDRIVSNYSTSGGDGEAHTMIFTGEYDDDGSPLMMENSGGYVPGGVSIRSLQDIKGFKDTSDPNSGLRVTRYNLGRDNLVSQLDKLKEEYMAADPVEVAGPPKIEIQPVTVAPIEEQLKGISGLNIPITATQRIKSKQFAGEISGDVLLRQVFAESSLDPDAVSPAGARGIAQFMPNTEKELQRLNLVNDKFDPLDPSQARNAQEAYMNYLSERPYLAKGSPEVQLAKVLYAYNRGPNAAKRNLSQLKSSYDIYNSLDWLEGINSESRNYINKILGKDEKFSKEYENILLDSTKSDIVKLYKKFGGDVDLKRIYKNFLDGTYDGTGNEKRAKDIYDKLNRMYYREAKSAGMSMPNYVMTYIIGNS
tara:strand:+ start:3574 stop:6456 length:2883 start_codon:yes stop_codon:yes gene_type:complete